MSNDEELRNIGSVDYGIPTGQNRRKLRHVKGFRQDGQPSFGVKNTEIGKKLLGTNLQSRQTFHSHIVPIVEQTPKHTRGIAIAHLAGYLKRLATIGKFQHRALYRKRSQGASGLLLRRRLAEERKSWKACSPVPF